jgi:hypothetical protein
MIRLWIVQMSTSVTSCIRIRFVVPGATHEFTARAAQRPPQVADSFDFEAFAITSIALPALVQTNNALMAAEAAAEVPFEFQ